MSEQDHTLSQEVNRDLLPYRAFPHEFHRVEVTDLSAVNNDQLKNDICAHIGHRNFIVKLNQAENGIGKIIFWHKTELEQFVKLHHYSSWHLDTNQKTSSKSSTTMGICSSSVKHKQETVYTPLPRGICNLFNQNIIPNDHYCLKWYEGGVSMNGTAQDIEHFRGTVRSIKQGVFKIEDPQIAARCTSADGYTQLSRIEDTHKVSIDPVMNDRSIDVIHGDLFEQCCGAIVIPFDKDFNPVLKLPEKLRYVMDLLSSYKNQHKQAAFNENTVFFQSSSGSLPNIIITVGKLYCIRDVVRSIMQCCKQNLVPSVAFPLILAANRPDMPSLSNTQAMRIMYTTIRKGFDSGAKKVHVCMVEYDANKAEKMQQILKDTMADYAKYNNVDVAVNYHDKVLLVGAFLRIELVIGDISMQKSAVIVNPVSNVQDKPKGHTSLLLHHKAGPALQNEYKKHVTKNLSEGDIIITDGGNLLCETVFHTYSGEWKQDEVVPIIIRNCLAKAQQKGFSSISIPAIVTADKNLNLSPCKAAEIMYGAAIAFGQQAPASLLQTIRFVVPSANAELKRAFENEVKKLSHQRAVCNGVSLYMYGVANLKDAMDDLSRTFPSSRNNHINDKPVPADNVTHQNHRSGTTTIHDGYGEFDVKSYPPIIKTSVQTENLRIVVAQADLPTYKCDLIVNAANEELKHAGGLARAIVKRGGKEIQEECSKYVRKNGRLISPGVYVSKAGRLNCKNIIHAVGPVWKSGGHGEETKLSTLVYNVLEKANELKCNIIAMPAISTGIFSFPLRLALTTIVTEVSTFYKQHLRSGSHTKFQVHLVDNNEMVTNEMADIVQIFFGAPNCSVQTTRINCYNTNLDYEDDRNMVEEIESGDDDDRNMVDDNETGDEDERNMVDDNEIGDEGFAVGNLRNPFTSTMRTIPPNRGTSPVQIKEEVRNPPNKVLWRLDGPSDSQEVKTLSTKAILPQPSPRGILHHQDLFGEDDGLDLNNIGQRSIVTVESILHGSKAYTDIAAEFQNGNDNGYVISEIVKINNICFHRRFKLHEMYMRKKNNSNAVAKMLWHGTSRELIDTIVTNGFNRSYSGQNVAAYFGKGVYFARDAEYSCSDEYSIPDKSKHKYVFYCEVLTGEYAKSRQNNTDAPAKDPRQPHALYDSTVNILDDPKVYVIFRDTQAYPKYLIKFE